MSNIDKHMIPNAPINLTSNDCKILIELVTKDLEHNEDIVKYAQELFLKRKLEECDKMLRERK